MVTVQPLPRANFREQVEFPTQRGELARAAQVSSVWNEREGEIIRVLEAA